MDTETLNAFEGLVVLARHFHRGGGSGLGLSGIDVEMTCFSLYDVDAVEEAFLSAANRIADRFCLVLYRLDVEDGVPSFFVSFGTDEAQARARLATFVERHYVEPPLE